ncbi:MULTISPECIES: hypothetical protein [Olivibacter]|uniref:Uncharacterized protein n=1 Tax=Olivibacter oleidegradans TaxID=760123 RepID=A0ABV6HSQ9_9SPHI|nr:MULTISPECIES: hypothetical protein [Olivibacter]QEL03900.1 hypothetical protein FKG96_24730 [Olivibacter sp. LS-1]
METAFLEYLDGLYWEGYGEVFREENPREFQVQLTAFICEHATMTENRKIKIRGNGTQYKL